MPHTELNAYLKEDIAELKVHNNILKKHANTWANIAFALIAALVLFAFLFVGYTLYIQMEHTRSNMEQERNKIALVQTYSKQIETMAQEHTKQIQIIFDAKWEVSTTVEEEELKEHVYQDDIEGSAVINNKTTNSTITNTLTK